MTNKKENENKENEDTKTIIMTKKVDEVNVDLDFEETDEMLETLMTGVNSIVDELIKYNIVRGEEIENLVERLIEGMFEDF